MVGAADHVRDAHVDIVHHHAELIGRQAVRAQQDEILDLCVLHLAWAEHRVLKSGYTVTRHAEPDGARNSLALFRGSFDIAEVPARASDLLRGLRTFVVAFPLL